MRNRFNDALEIQEGACNPIAIANAIVRGIAEIRAEPNSGTVSITGDAAIRLMVHQLAYICNVPQIDFGPGSDGEYSKLTAICNDKRHIWPPREVAPKSKLIL